MQATRTIGVAWLAKSAQHSYATRPFTNTALLQHKESSTEHDIDIHKHDSLSKQSQGKAEWKRELASDSEEAIRADKENVNIQEMQDRYHRPMIS